MTIKWKVKATFTPVRTDDLREECASLCGVEKEYMYMGVMDEGPYAGQRIYQPSDRSTGWIPECDLTITR